MSHGNDESSLIRYLPQEVFRSTLEQLPLVALSYLRAVSKTFRNSISYMASDAQIRDFLVTAPQKQVMVFIAAQHFIYTGKDASLRYLLSKDVSLFLSEIEIEQLNLACQKEQQPLLKESLKMLELMLRLSGSLGKSEQDLTQVRTFERILYALIYKYRNVAIMNFSKINLESVDLKNEFIETGLYLQMANLQGANLQGVNLRHANLQEANLTGANLQGVNLQKANLQGANLQGANLQYAILYEAELSKVNLQGVNLQEVNLERASLTKANLAGANLKKANLSRTRLEGANMASADLQGAKLELADLYDNTNLYGANLQGTNLRRADMGPTIFLTEFSNPDNFSMQLDQLIENIKGHPREVYVREIAIGTWLGDLDSINNINHKLKKELLIRVLKHDISRQVGGVVSLFFKAELLNMPTNIYKRINRRLKLLENMQKTCGE